jgi:SAM-dependent methyltransferase
MNNLIYRIMYLFTKPGWDTGVTPPEVVAAFEQDQIPAGPALDLGCGTGTNVIYMAQHGRQAIGVDFVPRAIAAAKDKARRANVAERTQFLVGDVSKLSQLGLPRCAYALDMGCFHGLSEEEQRRYAAALSALLVTGGRYMLFAADPHNEAGYHFGVERKQVEAVFGPTFDITHTERGPFGRNQATWYWMTRKA